MKYYLLFIKYCSYRQILRLLFLLVLTQTAEARPTPHILIAYHSNTGKTEAMAMAVGIGVEKVGKVTYTLKTINEISEEEVLNAQAIILGSPVYNANIAPQVLEFINSWPFEGRPMKDKLGAVFVTGGGFSIGEESVMMGMIRAMLVHGMVIIGGEEVEAAFGASAITGEGDYTKNEVDPLFLKKAEGLGKRVAEMVLKLK